jgi:UDP-glucose 4-epimerase
MGGAQVGNCDLLCQKMFWLITGGAGYIGSHVVDLFIDSGESVVVLDNLRTGHIDRLPPGAIFFQGDITSESDLESLFTNFEIKGIVNLAGLKSVEESSQIPDEYFRVNSLGVKTLLSKSKKYGVKYFIQSSTAAVYGNLASGFANESDSVKPISVYGESKLQAEIHLGEEISRGSIRAASLRYFNVVGAKKYQLKDTSVENLFPIVANAISIRSPIKVFGTDYQTRDGSCVRDYVHVLDVANAHLLAAREIEKREIPSHLNIGTGQGYTVLEVINAFEAFHKSKLEIIELPRRIGDPETLLADIGLAVKELDFYPEFRLDQMVESTFVK